MVTFKYKNQIISTPNLEKKLKRMKLTLNDIEIIPDEIKEEPIEEEWHRPLIQLKSSIDNAIYSIYSEEEKSPYELMKNMIWNPITKTGVRKITEDYIKSLYVYGRNI